MSKTWLKYTLAYTIFLRTLHRQQKFTKQNNSFPTYSQLNIICLPKKRSCNTLLSYPNHNTKSLSQVLNAPLKKIKMFEVLQLNTLNRDSQHLVPWERSTDEHETITDGQIEPLLITQLPSNMASSPEPVFHMLLSRGELRLPWPQHPHREDTRNPDHPLLSIGFQCWLLCSQLSGSATVSYYCHQLQVLPTYKYITEGQIIKRDL